MTLFDTFPRTELEFAARRLLAHVEANAEREGREYPAEAQALANVLKLYEKPGSRTGTESDFVVQGVIPPDGNPQAPEK